MKCIFVSTVCVLSVLVGASLAAPFPQSDLQIGISASAGLGGTSSTSATTTGGGAGGLTNVLSTIDLPGLLRGVNSFVKLVGVFCPPLSQVLDNVIQNVTSQAFRIFGRLILRGGLGGGGGGSAGGDGQKVSVVLPTFPPDEGDYDDDDDDEETEETSENVDPRDANASSTLSASSTATTSTTVTTSDGTSSDSASITLNENVVNNTSTLYTSPTNDDNTISKRHVRVVRDADDQEEAESAPEPSDDLSNVDEDADRDKRFSPFGVGISGHAGGAGGSGNFLFDIIRNTADRAARTVGTVYRMVAGTENLGWGLTTNVETSQTITPSIASSAHSAKLVAGSGATEDTDERVNAPGGLLEVDVGKTVGVDAHTGEGIPGPITRLFVIANRGIANLVQDLILRLAQTSERLVNFKARLVTSLI